MSYIRWLRSCRPPGKPRTYVEANLAMKERALVKLQECKVKPRRNRPLDAMMRLLQAP